MFLLYYYYVEIIWNIFAFTIKFSETSNKQIGQPTVLWNFTHIQNQLQVCKYIKYKQWLCKHLSWKKTDGLGGQTI